MGGFALSCEGTDVRTTPVVQRLIALLALQERAVSRVYVAGSLWPRHSERRAAGSLRSAIWRTNDVSRDLLTSDGSSIGLRPDVVVDSRELLAESRRVLDRSASRSAIDIDLFSHDLLPDWYDDWVLFERERLRHVRLATLERRAAQMAGSGDYLAALHAGTAAVQSEPLRESAHRVLVEAHLAAGNVAEAIRQFELYAKILAAELGLAPSPLITDLVRPYRER